MPLTKRDIPTSHAEAAARLNGRSQRRIGATGLLFESGAFPGSYTLMLHRTNIVTFHPDGSITLNTGGWDTVTTRSWINAALKGTGFRVFRYKHRLCIDRWPRFAGDHGPAVRTWNGRILTINPHPGIAWISPEPEAA